MRLFKKKINYELIKGMEPTSKFGLRTQLWLLYKGNVKEAKEAFDFLAQDLDIPDIDPPKLSMIDKIKIQAKDLFGVYNDNKESLGEIVSYIQGLASKKTTPNATQPTTTLPPIPNVEEKK